MPNDDIPSQIAELEASLAQTLPEAARRLVEHHLAALRQQRTALLDLSNTQTGDVSVGNVAGRDVSKGSVEVSGAVHGAAVGVNQGTIMITSYLPTPASAPGHVPPVSTEQIAAQRERLTSHRSTLATLLTQRAIIGSANVRPEVIHGINKARAGIATCKANLRGWGVVVKDGPDDK